MMKFDDNSTMAFTTRQSEMPATSGLDEQQKRPPNEVDIEDVILYMGSLMYKKVCYKMKLR